MTNAPDADAAHNDDQHPYEGYGSGDRSMVDDRRRYNILPTSQKNRPKLNLLEIMSTSHIIMMLNTRVASYHPIVNYYEG